jgi:DNA polymerase-3 subunit delta
MKATYKDILAKAKKGEYAPVYILAGEEPIYIDKLANFFENNVMDEPDRDFNQAVYYAKDITPEEVIAQAREFPFGVEKRLVIVKEAKEWRNLDAIKSYIQKPTETTILVICYKYAKLKETKAFEQAVIYESAKVPDYKLSGWVEECAKEHDFTISKDSAALLAEYIGNDLTRIDNEFAKLAIIMPQKGAITPEIIEKYIGISNQYNVFALRDAITARDEAKAYRIVNAFSQNPKNNPIQVAIVNLFNLYNSMLKYQLAPTKNLDEQKACFGYNRSEAQLRRDIAISGGYSMQILVRNIGILRDFDARAKGVDNVASESELYKELVYKLLH